MKNTTASIQHQLKQLAVAEKKAYQLILTRYFQERLLFRLATSPYEAQFCLKGGTLLYAIEQQKSRPTLDIDLLALGLPVKRIGCQPYSGKLVVFAAKRTAYTSTPPS